MESYSCTTYREQFNAEILNDKEKQEGCLQVKGDGDILRAEIQHISPKGRHTLVISSNPPMQQKAFQPWGKDNWPTQKESICLVNWRKYDKKNIPQVQSAGPSIKLQKVPGNVWLTFLAPTSLGTNLN